MILETRQDRSGSNFDYNCRRHQATTSSELIRTPTSGLYNVFSKDQECCRVSPAIIVEVNC